MQIHPPWFSLYIAGLEFFSITHDKSLMLFLIPKVLYWLGMWFSEILGFIIFSKSTFWTRWVVSYETWIYLWGMYYLFTLLFIINQWKDTLQYSSLLHVIQSLYLLSIFLVHSCENYLVARSTSNASSFYEGSTSTWYQRCNFYRGVNVGDKNSPKRLKKIVGSNIFLIVFYTWWCTIYKKWKILEPWEQF